MALIYHQRIFGLMTESEALYCFTMLCGSIVQSYLPDFYFKGGRFYTSTWRNKDFLFDFSDGRYGFNDWL